MRRSLRATLGTIAKQPVWQVLGAGFVLATLLALWFAGLGTNETSARSRAVDTMFLSDEPGNWFRSESLGIPLSVVGVGDKVDFKINGCCTDTRHTVTLLLKPEGSGVKLDQSKAGKGTRSAEFDVPGVYLFVCKVHPYMAGVVAVTDASGNIPPVSANVLPYIAHAGDALGTPLSELDALTVLSLITVIAPDDATKAEKWDIIPAGGDPNKPDLALITPTTAGIGEIWVNTQFERVPGQSKPGTITVVDAASFTVDREVFGGLDPDAAGMWNNPHNMWANFEHDTIYNANWFGQWINKIDRVTGDVIDSVTVGHAPTHIITNPNPSSPEFGVLHIPLSAEDDIVRVRDDGDRLKVIDKNETGEDRNHPHGHWLQCGLGARTVAPNVFKGLGFAGSISIVDTETGEVIKEFTHNANHPLRSALLMPLAAGECHVEIDGVHVSKAYVGNVVTGVVTVIDVGANPPKLLKNIPVTKKPTGEVGGTLFDTLQLPIQTPVSPDGKFVATAVFSLVRGLRVLAGVPDDHVAIIDTTLDAVVADLPTPAGTHGINWGAKLGGGYYAYVTAQHSNLLTVIDPDPNGDGDGSDAAVVGRLRLGAGPTDGTGGQGVKPLPMVHDGWIQPAVALVGTGQLSAEVEGWISQLTAFQKNPVSSP